MTQLATPAPAEEMTSFSSMEEYLRVSADSIRTLTYGDIVDGTVVRVDPDEVLVDIGAKSEGVISNRELTGRAEEPVILEPGDHVKVYVLQSENEDGNVVLSLRRARAEGIWAKAAEKESTGEGVEAEVKEQNKGGLIVNIMGLRGFLPSSQVARTHSGNLVDLVGERIMVKILEVNRKRNRLIVSQRAAQDEDRARQREELFERLAVGDVVTGKVSGLTSYGAFVNLGGADGLIHISELSWDRVSNVSDMLAVGDEVTVRVIKLDPELSRISLSLRQMGEDPWDSIEARFPPGTGPRALAHLPLAAADGGGPLGQHRGALPTGHRDRGGRHQDQEVRRVPADRRRGGGAPAHQRAVLGARGAHRGRPPGGRQHQGRRPPGGPEPPAHLPLLPATASSPGPPGR